MLSCILRWAHHFLQVDYYINNSDNSYIDVFRILKTHIFFSKCNLEEKVFIF